MPAAQRQRQRQPSGRLRSQCVQLLACSVAVFVAGGYIRGLARRQPATAEDAEAALLDALNDAVQQEDDIIVEARTGAWLTGSLPCLAEPPQAPCTNVIMADSKRIAVSCSFWQLCVPGSEGPQRRMLWRRCPLQLCWSA